MGLVLTPRTEVKKKRSQKNPDLFNPSPGDHCDCIGKIPIASNLYGVNVAPCRISADSVNYLSDNDKKKFPQPLSELYFALRATREFYFNEMKYDVGRKQLCKSMCATPQYLIVSCDTTGDGSVGLDEYRSDCVKRMAYKSIKDLDAAYEKLLNVSINCALQYGDEAGKNVKYCDFRRRILIIVTLKVAFIHFLLYF